VKNLNKTILMIFFALVWTCQFAGADGIIIPGPWPPRPEPEPEPMFSVKYHRVEVDIDNQTAQTRIDQVFKSQSDREMEATYIFPIPGEAAISEFSMYVDGKKTPGKILDSDEARSIYEDIVRKRRDPALLEYAGRDMFRARVFPVPPHGEKRIELTYNEINAARGNTYYYRYPLDTERFSSKPIETVSVHVRIKTDSPLKNIYSPSHDISVRKTGDNEAEVSYEETGARPAEDFELYYSVSRDDVGITLLTHKPAGEDGYFLLLASPKYDIGTADVQPKDVSFVFDRTGSMSGEKIEQAREALKFCLRSLNERDRFNVTAFNEAPDTLFKESNLVKAEADNVEKAVEFTDGLDAVGGTNIDLALEKTLPGLEGAGRPSYLLFLTDGLPTVGITDIETILENAAGHAPETARLFVFGVGYDVNTHLLDRLSKNNNGQSVYVRPGEDIEVKVSDFFRMISNPVLTDVTVDTGSMDAYDMVPAELPDIFKGSRIVIAGRFRNPVESTVKITGKVGDEQKTFSIQYNPSEAGTHPFIATLWASRRIGLLLDEIRLHGENKELVDEIVRLSKRYGIVTEYTSFLVEEPTAFHAEESDLMEMASDNLVRARKAESGKWAVDQAAGNMQLQSVSQAARSSAGKYQDKEGNIREVTNIRNYLDRAFFRDGEVWKDTLYREDRMKVIRIKPFSEAQFELINRSPRLGQMFAQSEQVIIAVSPELAVMVTGDGQEKLDDKTIERIISGDLL